VFRSISFYLINNHNRSRAPIFLELVIKGNKMAKICGIK
jgi:hypothetical protein